MSKFNLTKGNSFAIDKGISKVFVGLGWDIANGQSIDVDAHAFGCEIIGGNPKFYGDASHAVTYANKSNLDRNGAGFGTTDGSIFHTGDNLTGAGDGDDEVINIDLSKVPTGISEISIFATIFNAAAKSQNFGLINSCFVRVVDATTNAELCRYDLGREFSTNFSVQVGSLVKAGNGDWSFAAIGAGFNQELGDILTRLS